MINDILSIQFLLLLTLFFFINVINITILWYLAGAYLLFLGLLLLLNDTDILTGFLWVIDLGVGLIFFIFILHFTTFLHQKSFLEISSRFFFFLFLFFFFIVIFYCFFSNPSSNGFNNLLKKNWFFLISWYNYYLFFNSYSITELNLLREMYFYQNSFEFFLVNFFILYGLVTAILLCFLIKRFFTFLNFNEVKNIKITSVIYSAFFIRNQNFIKQQNTSTGTRVWLKKKINKKFDF